MRPADARRYVALLSLAVRPPDRNRISLRQSARVLAVRLGDLTAIAGAEADPCSAQTIGDLKAAIATACTALDRYAVSRLRLLRAPRATKLTFRCRSFNTNFDTQLAQWTKPRPPPLCGLGPAATGALRAWEGVSGQLDKIAAIRDGAAELSRRGEGCTVLQLAASTEMTNRAVAKLSHRISVLRESTRRAERAISNT